MSAVTLVPTPVIAGGPKQIASQRLAALSTAVAGLFTEHYGRKPSGAGSLHFDQHVITVLQDGLTPVERTLVERGQAAYVRGLRHVFQEVMTAEFVRAAEQALGRTVLSHRSSIHPEAHVSFEIFLLAGEARGTERGGLRLVGGRET